MAMKVRGSAAGICATILQGLADAVGRRQAEGQAEAELHEAGLEDQPGNLRRLRAEGETQAELLCALRNRVRL